MGKEALAVKRELVFAEKEFEGFLPVEEYDFMPVILESHDYYARGDELENNQELQQIIPYVWIINPVEKKIFAYKRAGNQNYTETRLYNKFSCGIGGHIERTDSLDPVKNAMLRELMEEVSMIKYPEPKIIGYINDDSDSVGKVHFGIVGIAETTMEVSKGDDEMVSGKFYSIEELEEAFADPTNNVENWTKISWLAVKEYLLN